MPVSFFNIQNELRSAGTYLLRDNFVCDRMVAKLRSHERCSAEDLRKLQRFMLLRTLKVATQKIPYYRDINIKCNEDDVEQTLISKFPIITKEDLLTGRSLFYPYPGRPRPWTIVGETGGTTGVPLQLYRSLSSVLWQNAFLKRQWTWSEFKDGMPRAVLRGDLVVPVGQTHPPFWFHSRYHNQLFLSLTHLRDDTADYYIEKLEQFSPYMIEAYPSAAYELAKYLTKRNHYLTIPFIFTGSETLYDYQRKTINERFRGRAMDHYGMGERITFATECEYGNLHVNSDHSYTEIVDENGQPTDDYGNVVGTTFHNLFMPLVRHRLSDQMKWKKGDCRCGRQYPMIEQINGRMDEIIIGTSGNDISPLLFRVLHGADNIERIQIAQVGRNLLEIRVVPSPNFTHQDSLRLVHNLHRYVDSGLEVNVVMVKNIPRTSRGKYRWVVNEYINGDREHMRDDSPPKETR
jgi:phenylacetate-CoA ligase